MSNKRDNFDRAIKEHIAGAEINPSPQLWARIESSMASAPIAPIVPLWRRVAVWSGATAATIALVVALNVWFSYRGATEQREYIEELIAQVEEPGASPGVDEVTSIKEVQIAQVVAPHYESAHLDSTSTEIEEVSAKEEPKSPKRETSREAKPTTPPSDSRYKSSSQGATNKSRRSVEAIDSRGARIAAVSSAKRGVDLSLLFAEGPSLGGSRTTSMPRNIALPNSANGFDQLLTPASYMGSEISHHQPISFAINVAMLLSDRVSIESGLNYTLLHSDVDVAYTSNIADQKLSYIGLPLRISYKLFESHNFALYASAGGMVERTLSASVGGQRVDEHNFQFSTGGAIGVQYSINKWIGLYCEPDLSYYLTRTRLVSIRNESPLQFTARAGVRFSL